MKKTSFILAAVMVAALTGSCFAGTATANLGVSASVSANCLISTSPVAFGAYDPISANASSPLDQAGTVSITCTNGAAAKVTLGQGSNAGSGSTDAAPVRRMKAGSNYLSYALYQDSGRSNVWGNTDATGVGSTGTGSQVDLTVYGEVAAGQNSAQAGSYSDTVVATVTF